MDPIKSILSFNASASNKQQLSQIDYPIQIMPSTVNWLTNQAISSFSEMHNEDILIHLNYITKVYKKDVMENNSTARNALRQYVKLAKRLGTKNILIHLPDTPTEYNNFQFGAYVLKKELVDCRIQFEIPAWKSNLRELMIMESGSDDPVVYTTYYFESLAHILTNIDCVNWDYVFDTAHLHSNGLNVDQMIQLFDKYITRMKFVHFNGNEKPMYKTDKHIPMFNSNNKIKDWDKLSNYCSTISKFLIVENTKSHEKWEDWVSFADAHKFDLVAFNESLSI